MYLFLFFIWFMLNGRITWEITLIGILLCTAVYFFAKKYLHYTIRKDWGLLKRIGLFLVYLAVLLWEIFKANWKVMLLIIAGNSYTDSSVVYIRVPLKTELARTILANSITLTPGTITISLDEDRYTIHALRPSLADGIEDSAFVKLLMKMEATL